MDLRFADAADRPCQMRLSHNPTPIRTQAHHRYPQYLQRRLWGEVRLQETVDWCGTDHDSTHAWLSFKLGEHYEPKLNPGTYVKAEVEHVLAWYAAEQAKLSGFGAGAFGAGAFGGARRELDAQWDGIE